jgi:AbrB family looped-hinge helix DNA binding protein
LSESRVGSKGEIFPPKRIRERLGLHPNTKIIYSVEDGRLVVEPVPTLSEVLGEPQEAETTLKDFKSFRRELSRKAESF